MGIEIVNSELDVSWLSGAQISYVDSVVAEPSDGGVMSPVGRQSRPLMQATFSTREVDDVWDMFGTTRSGRKGFFIRPPVERFKKVTEAALGIASGSEQEFQLEIALGTLTWSALYPVESTIIVYANGVALSDALWNLGDDGVLTLLATSPSLSSQAITVTFEYKTAVRFVDAELQDTIDAPDHEVIQTCTVREVF
jgi:hypothetical protein